MEGSVEKGLTTNEARELWNMILKFAGYGFNKSHSTAYALVAYQTAYLKTHYPVEFMAALLTGDIDGRNFKRKDSLVEHMEDCARMGVDVKPPSVNHSAVLFSVKDKAIYFGLSAIKGCGASAAAAIVAARQKGGPFKDLYDFCERVDSSSCNRSAIESLIKSGSMDCFGLKRSQLLTTIEKAIQGGLAKAKDRKTGQSNLFSMFEEAAEEEPQSIAASYPDIPELDEKELLAAEKEVLGFYLSAHPLSAYKPILDRLGTTGTSELKNKKRREEVMVGGMISSIKVAHTRNPKPGAPSKYANFDLEDFDGNVRCIMWPEQFDQSGHLIQPDAVVVAKAKVDKRGDEDVNLIIDEIILIDEAESHFTSGIQILVQEKHSSDDSIANKLREILRGYPGNRDVTLAIRLDRGETVHMKSKQYRVTISDELRRRLDDLLGPQSHRLTVVKPKLAKPTNDQPYRNAKQKA